MAATLGCSSGSGGEVRVKRMLRDVDNALMGFGDVIGPLGCGIVMVIYCVAVVIFFSVCGC